MISLESACKIAISDFTALGSNKIRSIQDAGDMWLFSAAFNETNYAGGMVYVEKINGKTKPFSCTKIEDLKILNTSPQIKVPIKYL